jgi:hypothetical protein
VKGRGKDGRSKEIKANGGAKREMKGRVDRGEQSDSSSDDEHLAYPFQRGYTNVVLYNLETNKVSISRDLHSSLPHMPPVVNWAVLSHPHDLVRRQREHHLGV